MKLHTLAYSRTGDKGDTSNVSIIAYRAEDYPLLREQLTAERVAAYFAGLLEVGAAPVRRYAIAERAGVELSCCRDPAWRVTRSLALDAHGKCLGSALLDLELITLA